MLFSCMGCFNNHKSSLAKDKMEDDNLKTANIIGVYGGELPCVDCEAIVTNLVLDRDNSYELRYVYEGKSADEFVRTGKWSIEGHRLILEGVDYEYKIDGEDLQQLDLSGNLITGDLAGNYMLSRIAD